MSTASLSSIGACLALTRGISRATSDDDIYTASLDVLGQALGTSRAAVLLFDPDGVMRFKAWRGLSAAYRAAVEGHSPWAPDSPQPRPIIVSDVAGDPSLGGCQSVFHDEGIGALAFIPLVSMGRVIGKFMLYYDTPHILRDDEVQLAEVIAAQVAFALARVTAEESLRVTDERMRFALDAAAMGTWELDLPDRSMTWSGNLERVHGYEPGDFDNSFERYAQIIHTEDRERVLASLDFAEERGRPYDIEYRVVGPDGVVRWIESKGRVEYEDGRAVRMTGICMAVTRRKQAEFARLADAHEANELKDQFLATLSHELRTPLNAILGWIQVLEHDLSSPDRVRHAMDIVKRNAKLQAQLIEDILDVSRIINGKLSIETQSVNIAALVDSTVSGLLPAAALKQIEMSCEIADRLPTLDGDPRRLQQVLNNVIANAIKFTPEDGTVHVRCAAGDGMLQIEVQDSGVGIDPELLPHVFDRFRQGDSRSTRRHGGLGLAISKKLTLVRPPTRP
jgi:PAS domain S-box-containing protein